MNVAIVFLISGFWHGANWTFVIWGAIHFIYVFIQMKFFSKLTLDMKNPFMNKMLSFFKIVFVFNLVAVAWIFFRAKNVSDAFYILQHIFDFTHVSLSSITFYRFGLYSLILSVLFTIFMFFVEYKTETDLSNVSKNYRKDVLFVSLCLFLIINFGVFDGTSFIYFQF